MTIGAWVLITDRHKRVTRMYWDKNFDPSLGSISQIYWTEGNFGCDCNRGARFALAGGEPDPDVVCGDTRFYVPAAYCSGGVVIPIDDI
jgi:hypothetical protein